MQLLHLLSPNNYALMMEKKSDDGILMKMSSSNSGHSKKQQISAIQGLRGFAIFAVLLFHIRPDTFKMGYLGVDIFFVISGYLMCLILSKQCPLDQTKIHDFYHRRIKRIVPVYLFVILMTLLAAVFLFMYPLDYKALNRETLRPLFYAANIPDADDEDYFVQSLGGYHFFRHLWSLSVEIQFYLVAPMLIFSLGMFVPKVRFLLVFILAAVSYTIQSFSSGNQEHMALQSRVWQFMVGFMAHYLSESRLLYPAECNNNSFMDYNSRLKHQLIVFVTNLLGTFFTVLLILFVSIQMVPDKQLNRLLLMFVTLMVVARPDPNCILKNWFLVELGNISYSVYMVHWPLFEWHKYWDIGAYAYGRHVTWSLAFLLIVGSIALGYILEKLYLHFTNSFLIGGKRLIIVVVALYGLILLSMRHISLNASDEQLVLSRYPAPLRNPIQVDQELMAVWNSRHAPRPIRTSTSLRFNKNFQQLNWDLPLCPNHLHTAIPTYYDLRRIGFGSMHNKIGITASCTQKGNGTKNIVVLGNSHAQAYYYGIEKQFRGVYNHLTMFSAGGCFLIRMEERREDSMLEKYAACLRFRDELLSILTLWKHPIDIIVVGHGYLYLTDPPITTNDITKDAHFIELQTLYNGLSKVAQELVLVPQVQFETGLNPHMGILQRKILHEESMEMFRLPYELERRVKVNLKKRISMVRCPKCVFVDFEQIFCNKQEDYCDSVEQARKLSYFFDVNHVNAYGSMFVGEHMRKLYNVWQKRKPKNLELRNAAEMKSLELKRAQMRQLESEKTKMEQLELEKKEKIREMLAQKLQMLKMLKKPA